jgi:hypothetical protein
MQTSSENQEVTQRYESSALKGSLGMQASFLMSKEYTANPSRNVMHASMNNRSVETYKRRKTFKIPLF